MQTRNRRQRCGSRCKNNEPCIKSSLLSHPFIKHWQQLSARTINIVRGPPSGMRPQNKRGANKIERRIHKSMLTRFCNVGSHTPVPPRYFFRSSIILFFGVANLIVRNVANVALRHCIPHYVHNLFGVDLVDAIYKIRICVSVYI